MADTFAAAQGDQSSVAVKDDLLNVMDVISSMSGLSVDFNNEFQRKKVEGNTFFRESKYEDALEKYAEAVALATNPLELGALYHNRGAAFEKLNRNDEALIEYTKALNDNPIYMKVMKRRARLFYVMEDYERAIQDLAKVMIHEFINDEMVRIDSMELSERIIDKLAEKEAEKLVATRGPRQPRRNAIRQYFMLFSWDPVSRYWSGVTPLPSEASGDSLTGYLAALAALKSGDHAKVIDLCTEELKNEASPHRTAAFFLRGTYRFLWNYGKEVLEDLEAVVNDEAADKMMRSSALLKCAVYHFSKSFDTSKMRECLDRAETMCKKNTDIYQHCAMHLLQSGYVMEALTLLQKAQEFCPEVPILYQVIKLGMEYFMNTQDKEVGEGILAKLAELEPTFHYPECNEIYGQCLLFAERTEEAQLQFDKAVAHDTSDPLYAVKRLVAQGTFTGKWEESALAKLYEYKEMDPESDLIYHHIAEAESSVAHYDKALEAMQKSIELTNNVQDMKERISLKLGFDIQVKLEKAKAGARRTDLTPLE